MLQVVGQPVQPRNDDAVRLAGPARGDGTAKPLAPTQATGADLLLDPGEFPVVLRAGGPDDGKLCVEFRPLRRNLLRPNAKICDEPARHGGSIHQPAFSVRAATPTVPYGRQVHEITIMPRGPYSLRQSVDAGRSLSWRLAGSTVQVAFRADDMPAFARIGQLPDGTLTGTLTTSANVAVALDELRFALAVDDDHTPFLEMAATDELLAQAVIPRRGVRPLRTSVAQSLLHGFAGQLIAAREAWSIERRITTALGTAHEGLLLPLSADELRAAGSATLVKHGLAPKRAGALAGAARRLDLDALRREPADVAIARLRREPMIGPWTSALVALNGLGSYAYGIAGDLNLIRLCSNLLGRRASVADTTALLARYGEWAGLASLHLARHPLAGVRGAHGAPAGTTTFGP